ncbi:phasin family protein [Bradyrhizobium sp. CCGUVB1N3]|uniref:phasin family protein n=1 Tax=Bradyrhizobium sp. CCGUVB1N3 TaxID=2949629 RepID=UPI0020B194B6|nr:phasin family protein [Bradyrhizobium sp. CCGUVB1N3]MCP3469629.1 phasin family protein [Bradyrhizobium sp. CCGUVB1N3]
MLSADHTKPTGKSGQRNRKKKTRQTKADEQQPTATDQLPDPAPETIQATEPETDVDLDLQLPSTEVSAIEAANVPTASMELVPVSVQSIANAYGDYTRRSLEHAWSFVGRLASARSPAEVFELQIEFAKQACETLAVEAQKIADLHGQLVAQRVVNLEGFVARITQTTLEVRATRH